MPQIEIDKIDETLPYGANSEDVLNLIDAIKIKHGNDKGIKQVYGKHNIESSRKIIKAINISLDGLTFSDFGREYAYETDNDKKQLMLLKLLLKYPAYEYFLLNISNEKLSETSLEEIQGYWGKNSYGTSEYNRNDASSTFAKLIELAGLGIFKLGRKGKVSRIEWNPSAEKLIRDTHKQISLDSSRETEDSNQSIEKNVSQLSIDPWAANTETTEQVRDNSQSHSDDKETELVREVLEKSLSNEKQKNSLANIDVSVNIDMTDWEIDKIVSFFKAAQGVFKDNDEL